MAAFLRARLQLSLSRKKTCESNRTAAGMGEYVKLGAKRAVVEGLKNLWCVRHEAAFFIFAAAFWLFLAFGASKVSMAVGLGDSWGWGRSFLNVAGCASEIVLALAVPFLLIAGEVGDHGSFWDDSDWREPMTPEQERQFFLRGCGIAAVMLALNFSRFMAPWLDVPGWFGNIFVGWWGFVDAVSILIVLGTWFGILVASGTELIKKSIEVDVSIWRLHERDAIDSVSKKGHTGSGAKRI